MLITYDNTTINDKLCYKVSMTNCKDAKQVKDNYYNFLSLWKELYTKKISFCYFFDTSKLTTAPMSYCYSFAKFLKYMKKEDKQYLEFSIIIISNSWVRWLLDLILKLEKPLATLYIVKTVEDANCLLDYKTKNDNVLLESYILEKKINVIDA